MIKKYQQQYIIPDQAWSSSNCNKWLTWGSQRNREDEAKQLFAIYGLAPSDKARINVPPAVINQRKKKVKNRLQVRFEISQAPNPILYKKSSPFLVLYTTG